MRYLFLLLLSFSLQAFAQSEEKPLTLADIEKAVDDTLSSKWYERIAIRGYAHFRYNRSFETNRQLKCATCDKSIGDKQGFFFRRARLVFFGDVNDSIYTYIQVDYSNDATNGTSTQQNYLQLRDAYFDYHLDSKKEYRIRAGNSKVPFGYENLQSSQNRPTIDRSDAINSALPSERDMGVFLLYAPDHIRKLYSRVSNWRLKGSGDYGVFSVGVHNGQSMNRPEKNNDLHRFARLTYPFELGRKQILEASIQGYEGKFNGSDNKDTYEQRTAGSIILYPQPFGFQIEYNEGLGPEYDAEVNAITKQRLKGGYILVNYSLDVGNNRYFPFVRYQEYQGGKKIETNATATEMNEWEIGTEWQPNNAFELTAAYMISDRKTQSSLTNKYHEKGNALRLQAQFNY
jgi:Phosphate-selective porin O and P